VGALTIRREAQPGVAGRGDGQGRLHPGTLRREPEAYYDGRAAADRRVWLENPDIPAAWALVLGMPCEGY
jgi:hypothetical protein